MADREDTDPTALKGRTDPGLGGPTPPESGKAKAARPPVPPPVPGAPAKPANGGADVAPVDFDALHAALGSNNDAARRAPSKADAVDIEIETPEAPQVAESQGRSSASYATTHVVPASSSPADADPSVPAVIVENDTNPGAQVTVPLGAPVMPSSGPHLAAPPATSSGPHVAAIPSAPMAFTPPGAFPVQRSPGQRTMLMPQRPRRAKSATVVVRARGPSTFQKIAAFVAMLLLVTACGIAVIVWRKPRLLGFEPLPAPSASAAHVVPPGAPPSPSAAPVETVSAAPPVTATAAPSISAAPPVVKKILPKPTHSAH